MIHAVGVEPSADPRMRSPSALTTHPWRGVCSCGWKGEAKQKKAQAVTEAAQHLRGASRRP